jgi:hypothetical protein
LEESLEKEVWQGWYQGCIVNFMPITLKEEGSDDEKKDKDD